MNIVTLSSRQVKLLEVLLQAKRPLSLQAAAERGHLNVCSKTVRADFKHIQEYSSKFGITMSLNGGLITVEGSAEDRRRLSQAALSLQKNANIAYTDDRAMLITLDCLLESKIPSLDAWSDRFNVSRPCIQNDIKKVRQWLLRFGLNLSTKKGSGYYLEGGELQLREALYQAVLEFFCKSKSPVAFLQGKGFYQDILRTRVMGSLDMLELLQLLCRCFPDSTDSRGSDRLARLALYLGVFLHRTKQGFLLSGDDAAPETELSPELRRLAAELEEAYALRFTAADMAALRYMYDAAMPSQGGSAAAEPTLQYGENIVDDVLLSAELLFGIPFLDDEPFKAAFTELVMDIINDPNGHSLNKEDTAVFTKRYPVEYSLCQRLAQNARSVLNLEIPEARLAEVGCFIAAHVEKVIFQQKQRKKALLVVPESKSAASMIYWQLMNRFSSLFESIQIVSQSEVVLNPISPDIDCVISTVRLDDYADRNITIPAVLTEADFERLRRQLSRDPHAEDTISDVSALHTVCLYIEDIEDTEELFRYVGEMMIDQGYAAASYIEGILEHERLYGSGIPMAVPVAIPHTGSESTLRCALVCAVTKKPLPVRLIGGDGACETRIFLFPLLQQDNSPPAISFYSFLTKLRSKKLANALNSCSSAAQVEDFIRKNISL